MNNNQEYLNKLRHSAAHLLAAAVLDLYPDAKLAIGPSVENGFYYDVDFGDDKLSDIDLSKIENKMHDLVKSWNNFERIEISKDDALKKFENNEYKKELISEFAGENQQLTIYKSGEFEDLCRGGHAEKPAEELKHFKLLSIAGAYWRGDENNVMLTRIYGTAFPSQEELDSHLKWLEEAKLRDHRKLGKELDLFTFSEYVGSGLPLYTAKGAFIRQQLNNYIEEEQKKLGYEQVWTPQIGKAELFKKSGHYDKYKEDMFRVVSNYSKDEFYLKPMNCPQHTQIYASRPRSYRDLPIRMADFAMLYRDEKPGELSGLARVRSFSTDDTHIFCREDQVNEEIDKALQMTKEVMETFGMTYRYRLSTRGEEKDKYLGDPKVWDKVEAWAVEIMKRNNIEYYDGPGEAAFYAPKMDLMARDSLGREWQLSTIQIDYVQPERFELKYVDSDGNEKTPIMIHRAVLGSSERFMMVMIEHYAGKFPVWLSPVQAKVLPITDNQLDYAKSIAEKLKSANIRFEIDDRSETLQAKIRDAQLEKVPYMIIVGAKEAENGKISIRNRDGQNANDVEVDDFITKTRELIDSRSQNL